MILRSEMEKSEQLADARSSPDAERSSSALNLPSSFIPRCDIPDGRPTAGQSRKQFLQARGIQLWPLARIFLERRQASLFALAETTA